MLNKERRPAFILAVIDHEGLFQPIDMAKMYHMGGLEEGCDEEDGHLALPRAKSASSVPANVESEPSEDDVALAPLCQLGKVAKRYIGEKVGRCVARRQKSDSDLPANCKAN